MSNFSFEPLKLKLATNNIIIPMQNGVADLTNAETSAKIMLAGKELFPVFDERIGGRNYFSQSNYSHHSNVGYKASAWTSAVVEVEPNTEYTISYTVTESNRIGIIHDPLGNGIYANYTDPITLVPYKNTSQGDEVSVTVKTPNREGYLVLYLSNQGNDIKEPYLMVEKGTVATDWIPAPEDVLQLATLTSYNCSAAIVDDLVKITSHTPDTTRGWVDVTVNYGNLSNTKRLNWSVEGVEPYKPLGTLLTMNNRGIKL